MEKQNTYIAIDLKSFYASSNGSSRFNRPTHRIGRNKEFIAAGFIQRFQNPFSVLQGLVQSLQKQKNHHSVIDGSGGFWRVY